MRSLIYAANRKHKYAKYIDKVIKKGGERGKVKCENINLIIKSEKSFIIIVIVVVQVIELSV